MKKLLVVLIIFSSTGLFAQSEEVPESYSKINLGFGMGVDYGGFGGRITALPSKNFGLFAGLGYNLAGAGFNGGGVIRLAPDKRVVPCIYGMYGYNAVLRITGAIDVKKIYYGPSFGFGVEINSKRSDQNFFNIELLVPSRSSEFQKDIDAYKNQGVQITEPIPFSFSLGYHIKF